MFSFSNRFLFLALFLLIFSMAVFAQQPTLTNPKLTPVPKPTPPDEPTEVVKTEEIKVNISALDLEGNFADGLKKEDIVINEDGRLHQANIIQHIPAKVLILLDTGGENRQAKDFKNTRLTAQALVNSLQKDDQIAIMQYNDKIELISDWTSDKNALNEILDKKMNLGKRSRFTAALKEATDYLEKLQTENRHLVLITDGLDSLDYGEQRAIALRNLISTNINVHVFSYTTMEQQVVEKRKGSIKGGGKKAIELPPGADIPIPGRAQPVPIATINTDRAMIKKTNELAASLKESEKQLTQLTEDTNGIIYLPNDNDEMKEKTLSLAKNIDSQYVVTYTPKRPLDESPNGEIRTIEVTSKRDNVIIQAKRKLLVVNKN